MYSILAHTGETVTIPADRAEDQAYFSTLDDDALAYYQDNGYVVVRKLVPAAACAEARAAFKAEVKPFNGLIHRQNSETPQRNAFNDQGYVINPIVNVQSVHGKRFPAFRRETVACLTGPALITALTRIFGDRPKIVQSMFFEGNTTTPPHQDTYYLDSEQLGTMTAAWVALETIAPNAGRFFICPGSHKIDVVQNGGGFDVAFNHGRYYSMVLENIRKHGLKTVAPALEEGDVLFWNARTIHGSLGSPGARTSRQSLTAHYIPENHRFMQLQARIKPLQLQQINGINIAMHRDQNVFVNRLAMLAQARLEFLYLPIKHAAVKFITDRAARRNARLAVS